MLRLSFSLSICLHIFLLFVAGIILQPAADQKQQIERKIQAGNHKKSTLKSIKLPQLKHVVPEQELEENMPTPIPTLSPTPAIREIIAIIRLKPLRINHVTPTPTPTPTPVIFSTPTPTATPTPTPTISPTPMLPPASTATPTPTATPTATATPTMTPTATPTAIPTPTPTDVPTVTPTPKSTAIPTPTPVPTAIPGPTATPTVVSTPTATPTVMLSPTPTPIMTSTSVPTPVIEAPSASPESEVKTPILPTAKFDTMPSSKTDRSAGRNQLGTSRKQGEHQEGVQEGLANNSSTGPAEGILIDQYLQMISAKITEVKRYPLQARRKGWEGTVVIEVRISPSGDVEKVTLVKKSKYRVLDKAALQAIKRVQSFPQFPDGLTMQSLTVTIPVRFELK